jgi:hypothetical protein
MVCVHEGGDANVVGERLLRIIRPRRGCPREASHDKRSGALNRSMTTYVRHRIEFTEQFGGQHGKRLTSGDSIFVKEEMIHDGSHQMFDCSRHSPRVFRSVSDLR